MSDEYRGPAPASIGSPPHRAPMALPRLQLRHSAHDRGCGCRHEFHTRAYAARRSGHVDTGYSDRCVSVAQHSSVICAYAHARSYEQHKHGYEMLMATYIIGNLCFALAPQYGMALAARVLSGLPHGAYFGTGAMSRLGYGHIKC